MNVFVLQTYPGIHIRFANLLIKTSDKKCTQKLNFIKFKVIK